MARSVDGTTTHELIDFVLPEITIKIVRVQRLLQWGKPHIDQSMCGFQIGSIEFACQSVYSMYYIMAIGTHTHNHSSRNAFSYTWAAAAITRPIWKTIFAMVHNHIINGRCFCFHLFQSIFNCFHHPSIGRLQIYLPRTSIIPLHISFLISWSIAFGFQLSPQFGRTNGQASL